MSKYFDPMSFYKPPTSVKDIATREQCVKCHTDESPGWVTMWKRSVHANLDKIRKLTPKDDTFYKKAKLEEIEANLRSIGKLGAKENLKEVGCIDCHVDINTKNKADHRKDIKMATADVCGNCHLHGICRARVRARHDLMAEEPVAEGPPVARAGLQGQRRDGDLRRNVAARDR